MLHKKVTYLIIVKIGKGIILELQRILYFDLTRTSEKGLWSVLD